MNCPIWGSSVLIIPIREDPQPSEATGSPRAQVMWAPSDTFRRTFKLFWCLPRSIISL